MVTQTCSPNNSCIIAFLCIFEVHFSVFTTTSSKLLLNDPLSPKYHIFSLSLDGAFRKVFSGSSFGKNVKCSVDLMCLVFVFFSTQLIIILNVQQKLY